MVVNLVISEYKHTIVSAVVGAVQVNDQHRVGVSRGGSFHTQVQAVAARVPLFTRGGITVKRQLD